tara:strand:- start:492 stop:1478 length:987 start_codon:yes stop_codon:yes gene_type:complete
MATRRPLLGVSTGLKELTDAQIDYIQYELRSAYATYLKNNTTGYGAVYVGGSGNTTIGSFSDTKRTQGASSVGDGGYTGGGADAGYGPDSDYPAIPSTGTTTVATYTYRQNQNEPSAVTNTVYDADSYLVHATGGDIAIESTEANILDTILTGCISAMKSGDQVGTYRVSTTDPDEDDIWDDMGTFFVDTTYSGYGEGVADTTYKLWLKRDREDGNPYTAVEVAGWHSAHGDVINRSTAEGSNLINNVLLPCLQRRIADSLKYEVSDTVSGTVAFRRGLFQDTRLGSETAIYNHPQDPAEEPPSDTYQTLSIPSGSAVVNASKYFNLV